jgi:hypothetical protein
MRGARETWDSVDGTRKERRAGKGRREGVTRIDVDPDSIGDSKPARKPRGFRTPGETAAMRQSESGAA